MKFASVTEHLGNLLEQVTARVPSKEEDPDKWAEWCVKTAQDCQLTTKELMLAVHSIGREFTSFSVLSNDWWVRDGFKDTNIALSALATLEKQLSFIESAAHQYKELFETDEFKKKFTNSVKKYKEMRNDER